MRYLLHFIHNIITRLVWRIEDVAGRVWYQLKLLPYRPRIWWDTLWIRKDEFHRSLNMNISAMQRMNNADQKKYVADLARRREIAHERDLEND